MLGHQITAPVNAKCCGYPYNASLRPCFSAKGPGPLVPCRGCEEKQEVRLWCGICGKDAPAEAYVGYDHIQAVAKFWAEVSGKQTRKLSHKTMREMRR